jgi:hypothetical protein
VCVRIHKVSHVKLKFPLATKPDHPHISGVFQAAEEIVQAILSWWSLKSSDTFGFKTAADSWTSIPLLEILLILPRMHVKSRPWVTFAKERIPKEYRSTRRSNSGICCIP